MRIFGSKRENVTGEWRKLHNKELHNSYSLSNLTGMMKSMGTRWARHVSRPGEIRIAVYE
jgi:hypothetical protein